MMQEIEAKLKVIEARGREHGSETSFPFAQAIRSLLTALEYDDPAIRDSHLENAKQCFIDHAEEFISESIKESRASRILCEGHVQSFSEEMISPSRKFDEYGEKLQEFTQMNLRMLVKMQRELFSVYEDVVFSGAGPLQNEIQRWRHFENSFLKPWPWTSRTRKPVDRGMLTEAKLARERGEKGLPAEEAIAQLKTCQ